MTQDQSPIILCSTCRVTPDQKADDVGNAVAACPSCGQSDKIDEVRREVLGQMFHETVRQGVGPDIRPSGNSFVNIGIEGPKPRSFRWIMGA